LIDPHVHSVFRSFEDFTALGISGVTGIISVAFYPVTPSSPMTLIDHFRHILEAEPSRFKSSYISFYPSIGVHPRCIPPNVEVAFNYLEEHAGEYVAIGEVGLEAASEKEVDVLKAQLTIAKKMDVPAIIHTPRRGKEATTKKILNLLDEVGYYNVVVDHVNIENIGLLENVEVYVGLTVQHGKLDLNSLLRIVEMYVSHNPEKFLLDTDLGRDASDLFSLPKAVQHLRVNDVDPQVIDLLSRGNAARLFKI